jgi:hypothetical protein
MCEIKKKKKKNHPGSRILGVKMHRIRNTVCRPFLNYNYSIVSILLLFKQWKLKKVLFSAEELFLPSFNKMYLLFWIRDQ